MALYDLVREAQRDYGSEERVIQTFIPKIKTSLRLTKQENREDLEQELTLRLIHYVRSYSLETVPGLVELNQQMEK